jgi:hypothetical protein
VPCFERAVLNPPKLSTALSELHPDVETVFREVNLDVHQNEKVTDTILGEFAVL